MELIGYGDTSGPGQVELPVDFKEMVFNFFVKERLIVRDDRFQIIISLKSLQAPITFQGNPDPDMSIVEPVYQNTSFRLQETRS